MVCENRVIVGSTSQTISYDQFAQIQAFVNNNYGDGGGTSATNPPSPLGVASDARTSCHGDVTVTNSDVEPLLIEEMGLFVNNSSPNGAAYPLLSVCGLLPANYSHLPQSCRTDGTGSTGSPLTDPVCGVLVDLNSAAVSTSPSIKLHSDHTCAPQLNPGETRTFRIVTQVFAAGVIVSMDPTLKVLKGIKHYDERTILSGWRVATASPQQTLCYRVQLVFGFYLFVQQAVNDSCW
jgi:hypothetical protein